MKIIKEVYRLNVILMSNRLILHIVVTGLKADY
jgi:hypothetical protein